MTKTLITLMTAGLLVAIFNGQAFAQDSAPAQNTQIAALAAAPQVDDVAAAKALRAFLAAQRPVAAIAAADMNGPRR